MEPHSVDIQELKGVLEKVKNGNVPNALVFVYSSSCPYCRKYFPNYAAVSRRFESDTDGKAIAIEHSPDVNDIFGGEIATVPHLRVITSKGEHIIDPDDRDPPRIYDVIDDFLDGKSITKSNPDVDFDFSKDEGWDVRDPKVKVEGLFGVKNVDNKIADGSMFVLSESDLMKEQTKVKRKYSHKKKAKSKPKPKPKAKPKTQNKTRRRNKNRRNRSTRRRKRK